MIILLQDEDDDYKVDAVIITESTTDGEVRRIIGEVKNNSDWDIMDIINKLPSDCKVYNYMDYLITSVEY